MGLVICEKKESKQIVVEESKTVQAVFEWEKTVEKKADEHSDEFDGPTLSGRWAWIREKPDKWSLTERPGWMTIFTQKGNLWELENNGKNLLLMRTINKDFTIDTKVEIKTTMDWHQAGLLVYKNDNNYVKIQRIFNKGNKVEFTKEINGHASPKYIGCKNTIVYLRIVKNGNEYSGFFSTDGNNYILAGKVVCNFGENLKVGLLANNGGSDAVGKKAYFDYFRIRYKD
jgi:beta-xylosidase